MFEFNMSNGPQDTGRKRAPYKQLIEGCQILAGRNDISKGRQEMQGTKSENVLKVFAPTWGRSRYIETPRLLTFEMIRLTPLHHHTHPLRSITYFATQDSYNQVIRASAQRPSLSRESFPSLNHVEATFSSHRRQCISTSPSPSPPWRSLQRPRQTV